MSRPDALRRLQTARILAAALAAGPVLLWAVAWLLVRAQGGGLAASAPLTTRAALSVWGVAAVLGFGGALLLRSRAERRVVEARRSGDVDRIAAACDRVQALLIVAWALLEGPAVLAGALYLMLGDSQLILAAFPVLAFGMLLTFPRPEWFPPSGG